MTRHVLWALPAALASADAEMVAGYDAALRDGERRSAGHLMCRVGCTECCIGTFDITALDAARLVRGLTELARTDPAAARDVRELAAAQWRRMIEAFPGESSTGRLADDETARAGFFARFADAPCPALDTAGGACRLYPWRPLSCRTFGLPVRFGEKFLAPCTLNFTEASAAQVAAAAVEPDPGDREGALLAASERAGCGGDTTVCAAIATAEDP